MQPNKHQFGLLSLASLKASFFASVVALLIMSREALFATSQIPVLHISIIKISADSILLELPPVLMIKIYTAVASAVYLVQNSIIQHSFLKSKCFRSIRP